MNGASAPWPATLLPSKVANARVLTFGYDAHVADWRGMVSKNRIGNHSMNLLAAIATHREDDDTVSSATSTARTTRLTILE
jgi:protein SERAC1